MKFCSSCGNEVNENAIMCVKCGCAINQAALPGSKKRLTYILLGFFFGVIGIHNFYAGRTAPAVIQLVLGITVIGMLVTGLWALIDICVVTEDGKGQTMG